MGEEGEWPAVGKELVGVEVEGELEGEWQVTQRVIFVRRGHIQTLCVSSILAVRILRRIWFARPVE